MMPPTNPAVKSMFSFVGIAPDHHQKQTCKTLCLAAPTGLARLKLAPFRAEALSSASAFFGACGTAGAASVAFSATCAAFRPLAPLPSLLRAAHLQQGDAVVGRAQQRHLELRRPRGAHEVQSGKALDREAPKSQRQGATMRFMAINGVYAVIGARSTWPWRATSRCTTA